MEDKELTGRMRLAKPSSLRVFTIEREDADVVEVSAKRDRWKRCCDVLSNMNWTRIDCLSSKDAIIDTIVQDDETVAEQEGQAAPQTKLERQMLIIVNAQRLALENHAHMLSPLIDGYVQLANTFGARLAAMEKHFDRTLDVAYQNAILQAQVDGGGDENAEIVKTLMEAIRKPKRALKAHKKTNGVTDAETNAA